MKKLLLILALLLPTATYAYTVKSGETLSSISRRVGVSVQQLVTLNGIKDRNFIRSGQVLETGDGQTLGATPSESTSTNQGYNPVSSYQTRTTQYVSATATTIPVVSTKDLSGKQIVLANISSAAVVRVYLNFEPGTTKEEPFMCTGLTATSWTNCTRGLPFQSGSENTSTTVATTHNAGAAVIITNIGQFYNQFVAVDGAQTINGVKTFTSLPLGPTSSPSSPQNFVTLYQLQQVTSTSAVNGTTTIKGVFEAATDAQLQAGTVIGSSGAVLVGTGSSFKQTSTPNKVPVSDGSGTIPRDWIATSSPYTWGGNHIFNALFNVNGTSTLATSTVTSSTIQNLNLPGVNINKYLSCVIPAVTTTFSKTDTTSSTIINTTIPGGCISASGTLKVHLHFSNFGFVSTQWLTLHFQYGSQVNDFLVTNQAGISFYGNGSVNYYLMASTTSQQLMGAEINFASSTSGGLGAISTFSVPVINGGWKQAMSVDTTQNQTLNVSVSNSTNSATTIYTVDYATVEIVR